jgi:hypothetical protein
MKTLIVAPHPDDELLGVFHVMLKPDVTVLYVSSGKPEEIEKREIAVKEVAKCVGDIKQIFLRGADDHLSNADHVQSTIDEIQPDEIWYPAKEGGHRLHDELNLILRGTPVNKTRCYEYCVYGRNGISKIFNNLMNLLLKPFKTLWGFTPKFDEDVRPFYVFHFNSSISKMKKNAITMYRKMVGEPHRRINPYRQEMWK